MQLASPHRDNLLVKEDCQVVRVRPPRLPPGTPSWCHGFANAQ